MRTGDAFGNLSEEWLHDPLKLGRFDDVEDFFHFAQKHDFLLTARLGPELEKALDHRLRQRRIFLQKLHDAISQLPEQKDREAVSMSVCEYETHGTHAHTHTHTHTFI